MLSNSEYTKLFILGLAAIKTYSVLTTSPNLQIKNTHSKYIPQVGQQKHKFLFMKDIFLHYYLWRLQWLSKLVSRHHYDLFIFCIVQHYFIKWEIKLHNISKQLSPYIFCAFKYIRTDFFFSHLCSMSSAKLAFIFAYIILIN